MQQKRVLIVDDEETSRELAIFDIDEFYECDTASDAFDAYDKIWQAIEDGNPYDAITLDELMPGMDGIALLKIIRVTEKYINFWGQKPAKFIIISGIESKKYLEKMYKTVMEDRCRYIKKPFNKGDLLETINDMID